MIIRWVTRFWDWGIRNRKLHAFKMSIADMRTSTRSTKALCGILIKKSQSWHSPNEPRTDECCKTCKRILEKMNAN